MLPQSLLPVEDTLLHDFGHVEKLFLTRLHFLVNFLLHMR
jgi:hypothetical protein